MPRGIGISLVQTAVLGLYLGTMPWLRCRVLCPTVALMLIAITVAASPTTTAEARAGANAAIPEGPMAFDIPAQPLASALYRYGDATGREVLYNAVLTKGRRSAAVKGFFTPEAALRNLLEGTGLTARFMADRSFILVPDIQTEPPATHRRYYAHIQSRLRDAFCRNSDARPGRNRVVALLWFDSGGDVVRYERLDSADTSDVDRHINAALRHLGLGRSPPAGFRQPVLIMIEPRVPGMTEGCEPRESSLRPIKAGP